MAVSFDWAILAKMAGLKDYHKTLILLNFRPYHYLP